MSEIALQVTNLKKKYGSLEVLKGIDFTVNQGEIFGILGANGAGKSTTLECIEGVHAYNQGVIEVFGQNIATTRGSHEKIGVQLQSSSLQKNMTINEAMTFFCKWKNRPVRMDLLETFGLTALGKKQYGQLSVGQKRRLHLALALCDDPEIVILDEPTAGLDVQGRVELHQEIHQLRANGVTIILASHDMAEIELLCDRLMVIVKGEVKFTGTVTEFKVQGQQEKKLKLKTKLNALVAETFQYSTVVAITEGELVLTMTDLTQAIDEIITKVKAHGDTLESFTVESLSLEERFIEMAYTKGGHEDARIIV